MSRGVFLRFLLVLGLLAGCAALAINKQPNLGLDLRGGAQFVFQASSTDPDTPVNAENVDKTLEVLRGRVDSLGVAESTLVRQGEDRILVELPGVTNDEEAQRAEEQIGQTAKLSAHAVVAVPTGPNPKPSVPANEIVPDESGQPLELGPAVLQGDEITSATAQQPQNSTAWVVAVNFTSEGRAAWREVTSEAACTQGDVTNRVAFVLDGTVISSPTVGTEFCPAGLGNTQIESFPQEEAQDLAVLIEGGALPLELKPISDRLVGPTLGAAAIDASIEAGLIGLVLTGLFIIFIYRLVGVMATVALTSYALLAYAMLLALDSTLTLPGLAGFVLAIGLAIDANVLVFERAREEYAQNPDAGLRRALNIGFNKAWSAIIDSNVTTLLAAALLFIFGSGPIKGFGVTLSIGVVASMISALIIARVLTEGTVMARPVRTRPAITGIANVGRFRTWLESKDFHPMRRRFTFLLATGLLLVVALVGVFGKGLNLGVEFTGGRQLDYSVSKTISIDEARAAVSDAGFPNAVVQTADTADFTVRTGDISNDDEQQIEESLAQVGGKVVKEDDQRIGASLGQELRDRALIAFGLALLAQLIYLAIRFKWTFGVSAVVAMFHDVLLVLGLFAWLGKPIDGIFLAAALTIIGLSVNDTVVVFDRIRERWRGAKKDDTFSDMCDKAVIETLPRTVNTGLGAMFILGALAVLGGDSLQDFSIALLVGLFVGTYSSSIVAAPLVTYLQQKWPMAKEQRIRKERDPNDSGAVV